MNEHISALLVKPWFIPTAVGLTAFSGGMGIGYILGKRSRKGPYTHSYTPSYDEVIGHIDTFEETKDGIVVGGTLVDAPKFRDYANLASKYDTTPVIEEPVVLTAVDENPIAGWVPESVDVAVDEPRFNVFAVEHEDTWDDELEKSHRTVNRPYVITLLEYTEDDMGYRQDTLTYYEGDDILTDSSDTPIFQHQKVVGDLKFGHGSNDKNVVYIRNEKLQVEYEILRSRGSYETEVMGLQIEDELGSGDLRHSALPRFRFE